MRAVVFLGALCCSIVLSGETHSADRWSGKFVANYEAVYRDKKPVRSHVVVELNDLGPHSDPPVTREAQCDQAAWLRIMSIARQRNPGATGINWHGWAGRCWTGAKPGEPVAWSTYAHGAQW